MRRLALPGFAWTSVVVAVVLFWPWVDYPVAGCWRLVDSVAGCLDELAKANEFVWWTRTVPMLTFLASGYVVVAALAVRRWRKRS